MTISEKMLLDELNVDLPGGIDWKQGAIEYLRNLIHREGSHNELYHLIKPYLGGPDFQPFFSEMYGFLNMLEKASLPMKDEHPRRGVRTRMDSPFPRQARAFGLWSRHIGGSPRDRETRRIAGEAHFPFTRALRCRSGSQCTMSKRPRLAWTSPRPLRRSVLRVGAASFRQPGPGAAQRGSRADGRGHSLHLGGSGAAAGDSALSAEHGAHDEVPHAGATVYARSRSCKCSSWQGLAISSSSPRSMASSTPMTQATGTSSRLKFIRRKTGTSSSRRERRISSPPTAGAPRWPTMVLSGNLPRCRCRPARTLNGEGRHSSRRICAM